MVDKVSAAGTTELPDSRCLLLEMLLVCVRLDPPVVLEGAAAVCSTCMRASDTSCWVSARPAFYISVPDVSAKAPAAASRPRSSGVERNLYSSSRYMQLCQQGSQLMSGDLCRTKAPQRFWPTYNLKSATRLK